MNGDKVEAESNLSWSPYGVSTGKLVKDDGRDRYVNGTFWEALHTEDDMSDGMMSEEESDYEDTRAPLAPNISQYSFIFSTSTRETESPSAHPPQHHRIKAWHLFKSNIHPVATVLHIPSVEPMVLGAIQNPKDLAPNVEALMFVIYLGAVNSLPEDDTPLQFGEEQSVLLARFRRDADAAFTRSRLMETDDMLTLQTFVVYLILLRCRDPTYSWTMTGLAVRLSQSLGMHRDGSTLNLTPFEAEMRRRLWWNLCVLDTPASEDYSCSSGLLELSSFNSRRPMNVNDSALFPGMAEYPREQDGITDMSFTAARCWASNLWRTMIDTRHIDPDTGLSFASMTTTDKEAWVEKQRKIIYGRFPEDPSSREPLYCLTMSFIGTIIANLRIMVLNPLGTGVSLTEEQKRQVFQGAIECMVHSYRLRTDPLLANWSWLTKCYNEWHAFAIILSELCNQPLSRDADKAWRVVEQSAVLRWDSSTKHSRVHQWRSVMKTIEIARRRRKNGMRRRKSSSLSAKLTNPASYRGGDSAIGGPTRAGGPATRQSSIYNQGNQAQFEPFPNPGSQLQEFQSAMSQADQMMRQLEEADDMCDFTSEDGRLYFAES
ncbi:C6 transcription factor [Colletotrichum kahawae]|uniref:C6 transcription factor n=1 Tax=Colletotrichum kahawae TaxID=34407 RepID=A0AAE0DB46_COLKA|nr:C6 transcription factor [Colletotrichum kahawae]